MVLLGQYDNGADDEYTGVEPDGDPAEPGTGPTKFRFVLEVPPDEDPAEYIKPPQVPVSSDTTPMSRPRKRF